MQHHYILFETGIGTCGIAWSERGLTRLQLPERDLAATERRLRAAGALHADHGRLPSWVELTVSEVRHYAAGQHVAFAEVLLDLSAVGEFNRQVYAAARAVAWGRTTTYGALARQVGVPAAAQAVGRALSRNPVPIIVPCHRILASGGGTGGFSAFGGVAAKRRLLALEGVRLEEETPLLPGLLPAGH